MLVMKIIALFLIAIILIFGVYIYQKQTKTETAQPQTVKEFTVEGNEFSFLPASLTVKEGEKIKLVFKNTGMAPHNFMINGLSSTNTISGGQEDTVTFIASKKGTFEYYCSVGEHKEKGMVGKLIVE